MNTKFDNFATALIQKKPLDQATISVARLWYKEFTGKYAVNMNDQEVVDIYTVLHQKNC